MRWICTALLICLLLLSGCDRTDLYRYQSFSFGTLIEIKIRSDEKLLADQASTSLLLDFDHMHRDWHAWQPGKLTHASDMLKKAVWFTADKTLLALIALAKKYSLLSGGLFNPTIGKLIQAWGFQNDALPEAPPSQQTIDHLMAVLPTVNDIEINAPEMRGRNPQIQLDLGAIAKGYAISLGIQKLREQGINHALINAGGDLCGIGSQADRPWRIGIRNPAGDDIIASIELKDAECVFTSGDYERYFTHQGKRYHHIIDPRLGHPADQTTSVTVLHKDGALADAASTALFIAGPDGWQNTAKMMGIDDVMLIDKQGRIFMSPGMQKRIRLEAKHKDREIIISQLLTAQAYPRPATSP